MNVTPVTLVAPSKLTTSLRILGSRPDGYHLIDAEMVTLDLHDRLSIRSGRGVTYRGAWVPSAGEPGGTDLVSRALALVGRLDVAVEVEKRIPAGAGLGGGSGDAAAILRWGGVTDPHVAAQLGADVPFCVVGGRARVTGIGDVVEPLEHRDLDVTLLTPPIHCSSADVYRRWDAMGCPIDPSPDGNDLTAAAIDLHPEMATWRDRLEQLTQMPALLAGSGSTWFVAGHHTGEGLVCASAVPPAW